MQAAPTGPRQKFWWVILALISPLKASLFGSKTVVLVSFFWRKEPIFFRLNCKFGFKGAACMPLIHIFEYSHKIPKQFLTSKVSWKNCTVGLVWTVSNLQKTSILLKKRKLFMSVFNPYQRTKKSVGCSTITPLTTLKLKSNECAHLIQMKCLNFQSTLHIMDRLGTLR